MSISALGPYSEACMEAFELIEVTEELVQKIKDAPDRVFTSVGSIALGSDDFNISVGLKARSAWPIDRVAHELLIGDKILSHKTEAVKSLPTFTLPVQGSDGYPYGILTEDFTEGSTKELEEIYERYLSKGVDRENIPEGLRLDIYDALDGKVYAGAFGRMMGIVEGQEVILDFDDIGYEEKNELAPYEELSERIAVIIPS